MRVCVCVLYSRSTNVGDVYTAASLHFQCDTRTHVKQAIGVRERGVLLCPVFFKNGLHALCHAFTWTVRRGGDELGLVSPLPSRATQDLLGLKRANLSTGLSARLFCT